MFFIVVVVFECSLFLHSLGLISAIDVRVFVSCVEERDVFLESAVVVVGVRFFIYATHELQILQ